MKLKTTCLSQGIKAFFLDLDDSLIHTNIIFLTQIELFCNYIVERYPQVPLETFSETVHEINTRLYLTNGVSPHSWEENCNELCLLYPHAEQHILDAMVHIRQIYQTVPEWKEGSVEFLSTLKTEGIPRFIVTHADEQWTNLKIQHLGILDYVDDIHIVPARKHKTAEEWTTAFNRFRYSPQDICVLGDSIKTDVIPAHEAGVRKLIWMNYVHSWHIYRAGNVPEGTLTVSEVSEVIPLLLKKPW